MKNKIWSKNNLEYKKIILFEFCFTITFMSIGCLYCYKEGVKNNAFFFSDGNLCCSNYFEVNAVCEGIFYLSSTLYFAIQAIGVVQNCLGKVLKSDSFFPVQQNLSLRKIMIAF